jgi:chromosome segregation ATPase
MRLRLFIILFFVSWVGVDARAQVPEDLSSMPEQWQLTLDVIKSKAQTLLVENNGLQVEYRQLIDQSQKLQQSIDGQRAKNEQLADFLNQRHGQTDQQIRIEELDQAIKTKAQQARDEGQQLEDLQKEQWRLRYKAQQVAAIQNKPQPQAEVQLPDLRKQLENETRQEVLLENELEALKSGGNTPNLDVTAIGSENQRLQDRLDLLRLQKLQHENNLSGKPSSQSDTGRYDRLKGQKKQLESQIYAYESRMDQLRQSYLTALSWPLEKKKMVHDMVRIDARNNKMQGQIKALHEDIDVLKDQVAKLERQLNFAKGKVTDQ